MAQESDWVAVSAFTTEGRAEEAKVYLENVGMEVQLEPMLAEDLLEMVEGEWVVWVKGEAAERATTLLEMEFQLAHKRGIGRSQQESHLRRKSKVEGPRVEEASEDVAFDDDGFEVDVVERGDDDLWVSPEDRRVDRAFRVAIAGLIILPLEVYALLLSVENAMNMQRISRDRYWKAIIAGVISVLMCWLLVTLLLQWIR